MPMRLADHKGSDPALEQSETLGMSGSRKSFPEAQTKRRRFASQTKAQEFADEWRGRLWAEHFEHPDPIHNAPLEMELEMLQQKGN